MFRRKIWLSWKTDNHPVIMNLTKLWRTVCRSSWSSNEVEDREREEGHRDFDLEGSKEWRRCTCHPLQCWSALLGCQRPEGCLEEVNHHLRSLHGSTWFLLIETWKPSQARSKLYSVYSGLVDRKLQFQGFILLMLFECFLLCDLQM